MGMERRKGEGRERILKRGRMRAHRRENVDGEKPKFPCARNNKLMVNPQWIPPLFPRLPVDTGNTLKYMIKQLHAREPNSVKTVVLLHKTEMTVPGVKAEFVGWECPTEFVVGYGLDFAQKYRGLPFIGVIKPPPFHATTAATATVPSPPPHVDGNPSLSSCACLAMILNFLTNVHLPPSPAPLCLLAAPRSLPLGCTKRPTRLPTAPSCRAM
jgi:hypothetical protein